MKGLARSILRIVTAVVVVLVVGVLALAVVVRQPSLGRVPFPGSRRADPGRLEAHVRALAGLDPPRCVGRPDGLRRAADYVAEAFGRTGARATEQRYRAGCLEARNLVAAYGPETGPRIVVGAHYDVCGELPGADDDASGVAGLLELARLLDGRPLATTVELVAYSSEEPPFFGGPEMGSAVHARSLVRAGADVRAMIALEMIGYFTPTRMGRGVLLAALYPRRGDFVALVGRWADRGLVREAKRCFRGATTVRAFSYSGPVGLGADLSDQRNFWDAGYRAFMVTDTAFLRNPHYHEATDTPETLDYGRMAGVVDGVYATIVAMANARRPVR